ncbi:hypothetical protein BDC45DRAFT_572565 [Circinella umbellata]|nr:hypothetical protein BDC45DRAFT_572565 [Circinella umbellata]
MNQLSSSCRSSPSNTKRNPTSRKPQQIIIQEPNSKETKDEDINISFSDKNLMNDNSLLSPEPNPLSCHPTDSISARPSTSLLQQSHPIIEKNESSYNRNTFKNSRETRLSFQTESRTYHRRVSFDSTTPLNTSDQQHVVLRQASDGFERTRRSRIFLIPVNMDIEIFDGVKFTLLDLVDENDEIIAVGIYTQDPDISAQTKADELMKKIMEYHQGDKISMTVEVYSGKSARDVLDEMIDIYEPSMVIIASHKRPTKHSHEFSGTGIFKSGLKRCVTPIIFVPTQSYIRRASTGDIFTKHPCSSTPSSQDDMPTTAPSSSGRSVSEPQVKVFPKQQQQSKQSRLQRET